MRRDTLEKVVYDITVDRAARTAFREDADAFLARYRLDAEGIELVKGLDVRGLADAGVNPMLTIGLWMMFGGGDPDAYLARLRGEEVAG